MAITVDSADILGSTTERGQTRLTYRFVLSDRRTLGPSVTHRPVGEDHQRWLEGRIPALEAELNAPVPSEEALLRDEILSRDREMVKRALLIDDAKMDEIEAARTDSASLEDSL